jgi:transposase-like protein
MKEIRRYSEAFKLQVLSELERGELKSHSEARVRYDIRGAGTLARWIRQYGKEELSRRVLRVETAKERDQLKEMKKRVRQLESALRMRILIYVWSERM